MNYPFTAIVGQEKLKKALLLCAVNPAIGGLLIQGDKGTAKSTAARALAAVVPQISKVSACLFNCSINHQNTYCEVCKQPETTIVQEQVPFVNLPIGATEERIIGSLDLDAILLQKQKKFQPGLLAAVHQGILYIDEVNLLPDHLVDILLDVSAMGENRIEREGLSISHPSKFTLIGTMNPEEGQLRPQFLDRFALMVHVEAPANIEERTEVVRRRIAFEKDQQLFADFWAADEQKLQEKLLAARALLPEVQLKDELLNLVSDLCITLNIRSLRADIVIYKTALTLAALDLRTQVNEQDILEAADLALSHRSKNKHLAGTSAPQVKAGSEKNPNHTTSSAPKDNAAQEQKNEESPSDQSSRQRSKLSQPPRSQSALSQQQQDQRDSTDPTDSNNQTDSGERIDSKNQTDSDEEAGPNNHQSAHAAEEQVFSSRPGILPKLEELINQNTNAMQMGKHKPSENVNRGSYTRTVQANQLGDVAVDATVMHALQRNPADLEITRTDLQQKRRKGKSSNLVLFVVDASGSMAARKRMEAVKGTVLNLLAEAYEKRDTVGVITFRGLQAQVLLNPTQSTELAQQALELLPTGGRTPLPHALQLSLQLLQHLAGMQKDHSAVVVILTDGKANVPLPGTAAEPWGQILLLCEELKKLSAQFLVVDSGSDYFNLNKSEELALLLGAGFVSIQDVTAAQLSPVINKITNAGY